MKALWNKKVIAESDETIVIEGNHYFPPGSVKKEFLSSSNYHTTCPWKGEANYYTVVVDNNVNENAAWYYPNPHPSAITKVGKDFAHFVAFWQGISVME